MIHNKMHKYRFYFIFLFLTHFVFFFFFLLCRVLKSWFESQFLSYYLLNWCHAILSFWIKNENRSLQGFARAYCLYLLQKVYSKFFTQNMDCLYSSESPTTINNCIQTIPQHWVFQSWGTLPCRLFSLISEHQLGSDGFHPFSIQLEIKGSGRNWNPLCCICETDVEVQRPAAEKQTKT